MPAPKVPTDPRRSNAIWYLVAALILTGTVQLAGTLYFAVQIHHRGEQLDRVRAELEQAREALADDDATIAALHRDLARLARNGGATRHDLRRLQQRTRPRTVTVPVPGPTVTVTRSSRPQPPRHTHRPGRRSPTPGCTTVQVLDRCQTLPPVPAPTLPLR